MCSKITPANLDDLEDPQASDVEITLGVAEAGGRVAFECVIDTAFMAKPNWPGELAERA